jgi:hypothetical protein
MWKTELYLITKYLRLAVWQLYLEKLLRIIEKSLKVTDNPNDQNLCFSFLVSRCFDSRDKGIDVPFSIYVIDTSVRDSRMRNN